MEIFSGIHSIVAPLGERSVACYALRGRRRSLLFDTALSSLIDSHVAPGLHAAGIVASQLDWVVISHCDLDHSGGNAGVRGLAPRAEFCCHELDHGPIADVETLIRERYRCYADDHGIDETPDSLAWMRANVSHIPLDLKLQDGEVFALDDDFQVEVLHVPGHSRGHIALYDRARRILLGQDCVLGGAVPTRDGRPAFPPTYRYVDAYLKTIAYLETLPIDALLTAHYPLMLTPTQVREFLSESRRFVETADAALLEMLAAARVPLTMREMIAGLSGKLGRWPVEGGVYLVWPFTGHLERMEERRIIVRSKREGVAAYALKR